MSKDLRKNIYYGLIYQATSLLLGFVIRKYTVEYLGAYILGVNGVFENVVNMMNLLDFGICASSEYYLYKAFISKDNNEISSAYQAFKKLYKIVGLLVFLLGIMVLIRIDFIVDISNNNINSIRIYFCLVLIRAVSYYFLVCPRIALQCDGKRFYSSRTDIAMLIVFFIIKLSALLVLKSYAFLLVCSIFEYILSCLYIKYCFKKEYSFCNNHDIDSINEKKKEIFSYAKKLALTNVNYFIFNCTDNLVIQKIYGTITVGLISNYYLIYNATYGFITQLLSAIEAFVIKKYFIGKENDIKTEYCLLMSLSFLLSVAMCVFLNCLTDIFISFYFGSEYVMEQIMLLMCVNCVVILFQYPSKELIIAKKRTDKEVKYMTVAMFVNIICSIALCTIVGPPGVIIGTIISNSLLMISEDLLVYKHIFRINWKLILNKILYIFISILTIILTNAFCIRAKIDTFILRLLISSVVVFVIFVVFLFFSKRTRKEIFAIKKMLLKKEDANV